MIRLLVAISTDSDWRDDGADTAGRMRRSQDVVESTCGFFRGQSQQGTRDAVWTGPDCRATTAS